MILADANPLDASLHRNHVEVSVRKRLAARKHVNVAKNQPDAKNRQDVRNRRNAKKSDGKKPGATVLTDHDAGTRHPSRKRL